MELHEKHLDQIMLFLKIALYVTQKNKSIEAETDDLGNTLYSLIGYPNIGTEWFYKGKLLELIIKLQDKGGHYSVGDLTNLLYLLKSVDSLFYLFQVECDNQHVKFTDDTFYAMQRE